MINVAALERERAALAVKGAALVKTFAIAAEAENRLRNAEENKQLEEIAAAGAAITEQITAATRDETLTAEILRMTGPQATPPVRPGRAQSMGEQFVASEEYQTFILKEKGHRSSSSWRMRAVELFEPSMYAATLTTDVASGGALILPDNRPGIMPLPFKRLVIADLMASGTTDSNVIAYMKEKTFTNAAATVLEGDPKPESALTFEATSDPVRKIAHWLPVTEEMLEDVPQIRSYIDARLRLGVQLEEEDQLLNGTGTAPDILGLLLRPGLATAVPRGAAESNADAILRQTMTISAASFLMPDAYAMNPTNWAETVLTKSQQGNYLTAGPFSPIQTPTLWGLPVVVTPSVAAGEAIVGAWKQAAQVFRKGGIRVEASNSHADFFIKNLVAIRAEERLALGVYRPGAFGKVTNLGTPVYS